MALLALVVFCFVSSAGSLRRVTPLDGQFLPHLAPDPVTMNTVAERNMSWEKPGQSVDSHGHHDHDLDQVMMDETLHHHSGHRHESSQKEHMKLRRRRN